MKPGLAINTQFYPGPGLWHQLERYVGVATHLPLSSALCSPLPECGQLDTALILPSLVVWPPECLDIRLSFSLLIKTSPSSGSPEESREIKSQDSQLCYPERQRSKAELQMVKTLERLPGFPEFQGPSRQKLGVLHRNRLHLLCFLFYSFHKVLGRGRKRRKPEQWVIGRGGACSLATVANARLQGLALSCSCQHRPQEFRHPGWTAALKDWELPSLKGTHLVRFLEK